MREIGFEPTQALSHESLNLAHLTTLALPHLNNKHKRRYKKLYKLLIFWSFEDGHNRLETPVPIPNTEVKLPMLTALVPHKAPNNQAVFHIFENFYTPYSYSRILISLEAFFAEFFPQLF